MRAVSLNRNGERVEWGIGARKGEERDWERGGRGNCGLAVK